MMRPSIMMPNPNPNPNYPDNPMPLQRPNRISVPRIFLPKPPPSQSESDSCTIPEK